MSRFVMCLLSLFSMACLAPPESAAGPEELWCPAPFEDMATLVLERDGLSATSTFFPQGEVADQRRRYPGRMCPAPALALAIRALLASSEPESLFDVSQSVGVEDCGARCYFNRETSLFGIVADDGSPLQSRLLPLPPVATSVSEHWIFFLSVPDLGEHGYWALVARDGSGVATVASN
jgi:hypothetical protein